MVGTKDHDLSEVSQTQKVMFSLVCGSYTQNMRREREKTTSGKHERKRQY
jgi:hypothetical protein